MKKRTLIYVFAILLGVGICTLCASVKETHDDMEDSVSVMEMNEFTVLIDAGHGGFDAGASANGIDEKDINLCVAKKLKDEIEGAGGRVCMTREEDISTEDKNRTDGSSAKKSDLRQRKAMIRECGANMFVSIHMNKFPETQYWGAQVFYAANSDDSQRLGEAIQAALPKVLNDGNERVAKKSDGSIYILKNNEIPSVVVECGFLSNSEEAEKLKSDEYQGQLARAIYTGICDYLGNES